MFLQESLESCVSDVVEVLATDAVDGPILWRLSAISALSAVFHRLCPSATSFGGARLSLNSVRFGRRRAGLRDGYGSAAFVQALQVIHLRGYLHKLLTSCLCNPTMGNAQEQELLFTNTMVLCVSVASSVEGVEALVANGILDHVIDLQYFVDPPPFPEELLAYGMETQATQQELTLLLQRRLQPVLQLLRMMCATSPSQQLLHGVARFVQKNSKMVSNLMRLRYLSLNGLRLTESLIGLLAEAITCMDVVRISGEEVEISSHWEILFGHLSMDSLNDVWLLLGTLGMVLTITRFLH